MDRIRLNIQTTNRQAQPQTTSNNLQQHTNFIINNFNSNNNHHVQYTAARNNIKSVNNSFYLSYFKRLGIHDGSIQLIGSSIGDYTKLLIPLMQNLSKSSQPFLNFDLIEQFPNQDNCWMPKSNCCYVSHEFLMNVLLLSNVVEKDQRQKICHPMKSDRPDHTYYWELTPSQAKTR
ncbi:hypothetical protein WICANDRAFT_79615 [Wickerhamomyces anomalus NRRL Y-366-8]|uniref:Uncharacterized protein n=1 Tax=Wickerhamomyces anomalus (strain ATCC 58044 / CBS 1984 / NCYC 433 / NRRL Y-366-8) TaxID=683960 RepID=A0A1E3P2F8_WICAA|nr:uncharacterized protein WICANDRAFT_79615 [Wickerhamomyces anomalus NRRL Y-366-8]ODQ59082.1 hypothetical protein WICANDRAFT_79615 [Wickerhamomyces anomalus NRRL Y-366-8]